MEVQRTFDFGEGNKRRTKEVRKKERKKVSKLERKKERKKERKEARKMLNSDGLKSQDHTSDFFQKF